MRLGQMVIVIDHRRATRWHRALVGKVRAIVALNIYPFRRSMYGPYHLIDGAPYGIAEICLRPLGDDAEFAHFLDQLLRPQIAQKKEENENNEPLRRENAPATARRAEG